MNTNQKIEIKVFSSKMEVFEENELGYETEIHICVDSCGKEYFLVYLPQARECENESLASRFALNGNATWDDSLSLIEDLCQKYGIDQCDAEKAINDATAEARAPLETKARKFAEAHAAETVDPKVWKTESDTMITPSEIKNARMKAGLTQAQAAALVHAGDRAWRKWETSRSVHASLRGSRILAWAYHHQRHYPRIDLWSNLPIVSWNAFG